MIDVIVLGAGAAGLFCAGLIAKSGKRVVVLEHNDKPGKKIRISGGGRCNFTNREVSYKNFISQNPNFARSALQRYTPQDFIALVDSYNIGWHEKTLGQLFCDSSAQQIIDMLVQECHKYGAEIHYAQTVQNVQKTTRFMVSTPAHQFECAAVVVATGGLSIPTLGASDVGYRIAKSFDLPIVSTNPALVPLTFSQEFARVYGALAGISIDSVVKTGAVSFRENLLFTHRGLSGPAILQASSYVAKNEPLSLDLLPDVSKIEELFPNASSEKRKVRNALADILPQRYIETLHSMLIDTSVNQTKKVVLQQLFQQLKQWQVVPTGNEGYAKAEVTKGGVDTRVLSSKTMETNNTKGLYFIGEVVDVTGWLGGYNFQWAWSSAFAASQAISER